MSKNRKTLEYYRLPDEVYDSVNEASHGSDPNKSTRFANANRIIGDVTLHVSPPATRNTYSATQWLEGVNRSGLPDGDDSTADGTITYPFASIQAAFDILSDKIISSDAVVTVQMAAGEWHYQSIEALVLSTVGSSNTHLIGTGYNLEDVYCEVTVANRIQLGPSTSPVYTDPAGSYQAPTNEYAYEIQYKILRADFTGNDLPEVGDAFHADIPDMYKTSPFSGKKGLANMCGAQRITGITTNTTWIWIDCILTGYTGAYLNPNSGSPCVLLTGVDEHELRNLNLLTSSHTNVTINKTIIESDTWNNLSPTTIDNNWNNCIELLAGTYLNISYLAIWNPKLIPKFNEYAISVDTSTCNIYYCTANGFLGGYTYSGSSGRVTDSAASNCLRGFRAENGGLVVFQQSCSIGNLIGAYMKQGVIAGQAKMVFSGCYVGMWYTLSAIGRQYYSSDGSHFFIAADCRIGVQMENSSTWKFTAVNYDVTGTNEYADFKVDEVEQGGTTGVAVSIPITSILFSLVTDS